MPENLVERWLKDYGEEKTEKILADFLTEKSVTVRCRVHKYPQEEIYQSLVNQGVEVKPAPYLPYAYEISNYNHILALDAFIQGKIQVQDVSSMLVAIFVPAAVSSVSCFTPTHMLVVKVCSLAC